MTSVPAAGGSRDRAGRLPGEKQSLEQGVGGRGGHGRSPGHNLLEVSGGFGCCPPSFPLAQLLSGFLSLPLVGLSVLVQTFLKSFFFWKKKKKNKSIFGLSPEGFFFPEFA